MKKFITLGISILILFAVIWVGLFYIKNLRGIGPVISPVGSPSDNLTGEVPTRLKVAEGFSAFIFAKNLVNPRVLIKDKNGVLLTSITAKGKVVALPDKDNNGVADDIITIAGDLKNPHGIAMYCLAGIGDACRLYIAESNAVFVYDYDSVNFKVLNKKKIIDLPDDGGHYTRSLLIAKGKLLISIGSSCNVCIEKNDFRAKILQSDADGKSLKPFASGLRNSVFMTVNPADEKIYATEMGRDLLGDDIPPDEINIIEEGKNYGFPNCYGKNIHDDNFDHNTYIRNPCMEPFETPSFIDIPAHSAPLGLAFYGNDLLVALHGSWNRTVPTGYKVIRYDLNSKISEDFITGWLDADGKTAWGRPAGILVDKDKNIFISDDKAGFIYLVRRAQ